MCGFAAKGLEAVRGKLFLTNIDGVIPIFIIQFFLSWTGISKHTYILSAVLQNTSEEESPHTYIRSHTMMNGFSKHQNSLEKYISMSNSHLDKTKCIEINQRHSFSSLSEDF